MMPKRAWRSAVLLASCLGATASVVAGDGAMSGQMDMDMSNMVMSSTVHYTVPDIQLISQDGKSVSLRQQMDDGRPVVLNFMYTSCTTTCPMLTQTLSVFQGKLGEQLKNAHLMSISIDPEQDTPARLREYAKKFHAGTEWQFYTGTLAASLAAQHAFDVYRGDKMSHTAVTLLRAAPGAPWLRVEGLVTADELARDYRDVTAAKLAAE